MCPSAFLQPAAEQNTEAFTLQVAAFQRPQSLLLNQEHVDIVCGVDFSTNGWHLATAGIRKQVRIDCSQYGHRSVFVHGLLRIVAIAASSTHKTGH